MTKMTKRVLIPAVAAMLASLGVSGSVMAATSSVELHFAGAERITPNGTGGLDIVKADGSLWHYRPKVYQMVNGKRHDVMPAYHIVDKDKVDLEVRNADPQSQILVSPRP